MEVWSVYVEAVTTKHDSRIDKQCPPTYSREILVEDIVRKGKNDPSVRSRLAYWFKEQEPLDLSKDLDMRMKSDLDVAQKYIELSVIMALRLMLSQTRS
jgi:hypothetical protein